MRCSSGTPTSKYTECMKIWIRMDDLLSSIDGALSGGVAPTVITATVRIIREVSATAAKALPVRP